ncbi:Fic family protein [Dyadobacter psychrophilus]|uniref:Fic family protein n=1 Tax=Dyadobacter psychrophilus TaxID=651661 RepID=A0A1T5DIJ8_9BACT|nr:Fic family protein [Dyadobacter psychrophilus]SKB71320.1 Fic family protein [Dyadobacter psychrophilus]
MAYNWELSDWPNFTFSFRDVEAVLYDFAMETGEITGILKSLPPVIQEESLLQLMLSEAIKTSEIEGEFLSRLDVMSSIRNNMGLNAKHEQVRDPKARGIGALMVDVRKTFAEPLSDKTLFDWHQLLFTAETRIQVGRWRTGSEPMQVISGSIGKEEVHFQAPPSMNVPAEMEGFLAWFNETAPGGGKVINSAPIRAAIAHLYFETIHPFEDGNGRIGRAIAEKTLSQTLGRPIMMSLSRTIEADKKGYYAALKKAQQTNNITDWINYFVNITLQAQRESRELIDFTLKKTQFFDLHKERLNDRQLKVIQRMLEAGQAGFDGGMSAKKYMAIAKTSKATATRDLQTLLEMNVLQAAGGGRSVRYGLNI